MPSATAIATDTASRWEINDRAQLEAAEAYAYARTADRLRRAGVTLRGSVRIDADVVVEPDALIDHGVVLRGKTVVKPRGARRRRVCRSATRSSAKEG